MKKIFLTLILMAASLALWAFWGEPSRTVYREQSVRVESLPSELSGLKVALLTDLHIGSPHVSIERLREIVAKVNRYQPDMILLGGDYMVQGVVGGKQVAPSNIFAELNHLKASIGVFAVMGNHDWWYGYKAIIADFEKYSPNVTLLEDKAVTLTYNGKAFSLLGITDFNEGPHQYEPALSQHYTMALTHTPDIFPELAENISLTFAGHTHGGQVYIPFLGRPIVPSRYGEKYAIGLITEAQKQLFVSAGIGTSILGVRFLTPPEVNILTLLPPLTPAP